MAINVPKIAGQDPKYQSPLSLAHTSQLKSHPARSVARREIERRWI